MTIELSFADLESEICTELPERNLMRRRCRHRHHHHAGGGASASNGSAANANRTTQVNFNPQIVVNNGKVDGGINVTSHNRNTNTSNQTGIPINLGL